MKSNDDLNAELRELLTGDDGRRGIYESISALSMESVCQYRDKISLRIEVAGICPHIIIPCECRDEQAGYVPWIWANREGQPWQQALETHVANYREPAPDYDWKELLLVTLRGKGIGVVITACEEFLGIRLDRKYRTRFMDLEYSDPDLPRKVKQWAVDVLRAQRESLKTER